MVSESCLYLAEHRGRLDYDDNLMLFEPEPSEYHRWSRDYFENHGYTVSAEDMMERNYEKLLREGWLPENRTLLFPYAKTYHNGELLSHGIFGSGVFHANNMLNRLVWGKSSNSNEARIEAYVGVHYVVPDITISVPTLTYQPIPFRKGINPFDGFRIETVPLTFEGFYHTSILIFVDEHSEYYNKHPFNEDQVDDRGMQYISIGAGPEKIFLDSDLNRRKDVMLDIKVDLESISLDIDDERIGELLQLEQNFDKNKSLIYFWFPEALGYNSNSFISGLLLAGGYDDVTRPPQKVPGWDTPVPEKYFRAPEPSYQNINRIYDIKCNAC